MTLLMLDLFSGLGGASQCMRRRGWDVVTLDNDPRFDCDITTDIRSWSWSGARPDLVWGSPPCTEFSRESMPWCRTGKTPDLSLVESYHRIVGECKPRFWILENVRGAVPFLGKPAAVFFPFYLWGFFPPLGSVRLVMKKKESYSSKQQAERAMIPEALSLRVAESLERAVEWGVR